VANDPDVDRQLVLITNIPLERVAIVQQISKEWRRRSRIERSYRFDLVQGLDVEDMWVRALERM
jgi:hypothetical protein